MPHVRVSRSGSEVKCWHMADKAVPNDWQLNSPEGTLTLLISSIALFLHAPNRPGTGGFWVAAVCNCSSDLFFQMSSLIISTFNFCPGWPEHKSVWWKLQAEGSDPRWEPPPQNCHLHNVTEKQGQYNIKLTKKKTYITQCEMHAELVAGSDVHAVTFSFH